MIAFCLAISVSMTVAVMPVAAQKTKTPTKQEVDQLRAEVARLRADLDAALKEINALKAAIGGKPVAPEEGPLYRGRNARYWQEQLKDADTKVCIEALEALGALARTDKKLIPVLVEAVKTGSDSIPYYAVKALGAAGPDVLPALIDILKENKRYRAEAAKAIGKLGPIAKPAVPALLKALEEESQHANSLSIFAGAIHNIGPDAKEAIPALVKAMGACLEDIGKPIENTGKSRFGISFGSANVRILEALTVLDPKLATEVPLPPVLKNFGRAPTREEQEAWRAFHAALVKRYAKPK
ncbi:MAG: HEAT repeat domain-containing protein [Planctomycetes bacterium]|nr:HEAT repeat domain-containing protein [Planctomycetota bacterium]